MLFAALISYDDLCLARFHKDNACVSAFIFQYCFLYTVHYDSGLLISPPKSALGWSLTQEVIMARYKHRKDAALPDYVYRDKGRNRVRWREYLGNRKFGRAIMLRGENGKPLTADASHRDIISAYNTQVANVTTRSLSWLINEYFKSQHFASRSSNTQRAYQVHARTMCMLPTRNGRTFGDAPLRALDPPAFSRYRDKRSETAPISANRELQFIRAVFNWGIEYGLCERNPARHVRLNPSQSRDRYITDDEYALVAKNASEWLALAMEFAYLLRARASEVLALTPNHVRKDGILLERSKGSDSEITLWSERLRQAVSRAQKLPGNDKHFLLHNSKGHSFSYSALRSAFVRALDKAEKDGLEERFTFHDIKAKGITDHKTNHGGHRSERMRKVYVRLPERVDSTK